MGGFFLSAAESPSPHWKDYSLRRASIEDKFIGCLQSSLGSQACLMSQVFSSLFTQPQWLFCFSFNGQNREEEPRALTGHCWQTYHLSLAFESLLKMAG